MMQLHIYVMVRIRLFISHSATALNVYLVFVFYI